MESFTQVFTIGEVSGGHPTVDIVGVTLLSHAILDRTPDFARGHKRGRALRYGDVMNQPMRKDQEQMRHS